MCDVSAVSRWPVWGPGRHTVVLHPGCASGSPVSVTPQVLESVSEQGRGRVRRSERQYLLRNKQPHVSQVDNLIAI